MATSTGSTAPAKKSNTMMYAAIAIIIIIVAGVAAYFAFFSGGQPTFTPTVTIHLNGNFAKGWNGSTATANPTINIKSTDKVRIILLSEDGSTHDFVIAYSGTAPSATPAAGDKSSSDFSSTTTSINYDFTPDKAGTFKYYCKYHYTTMFGTIVVS